MIIGCLWALQIGEIVGDRPDQMLMVQGAIRKQPCVVVREATRDEYLAQEHVKLKPACIHNAQVPGARFYELATD